MIDVVIDHMRFFTIMSEIRIGSISFFFFFFFVRIWFFLHILVIENYVLLTHA